MATQERREQIIGLVRRRGFASIEAMAKHFAVTPQTIRRDINDLCKHDLLARYHGGAGLPSSVENVDYTARKIMQPEEKRRIARLVASHIPDSASLFINIGTTTEAVAKALLGHSGLRVITNNLHVATILATRPDCEVILAGGVVRNRDGGIIGEATIDFVRQFRVDYGIIGISGIDDDGTLLDFDYREVRVAYREREIIKLRYGIGDGYTYTLEEVGKIFKVTRERVRQVEAKAIRKLQHYSLRGFTKTYRAIGKACGI